MRSFFLTAILSLVLSGMASATGTLKGLWRFDDSSNPWLAAVGEDLTIQGTAPVYSSAITDDAGNGQTGCITTAAAVVANRIIATHGISPNGGGSYVNEYTILADVFTPVASRSSWRSIFQTNQSNSNDADYFIRNSDDMLGVGALGYSTTKIDETKWTRLVITVKLGATGPIVTYLDGQPVATHTLQALDGRFSLDPTVLFFSDESGDNAPMNVGMLAIWDGALSAVEVSTLGTAGAPVPLVLDPYPGSPRGLSVSVNQQNSTALLTWTAADANFAATGVRLFRNGTQIAELPLGSSSFLDSLPGGVAIQQFTYELRTYGGGVGDSVPALQVTTLWNPGGVAGGLVAYYRFENNLADSAPDGVDHPGTIVGSAPKYVADGRVGAGTEFNDTALPHQVVTLGNPAALQFGSAQDFAVSFWMRHPFDASANHTVFGGNDGYGAIIANKNWLSGTNRGWVVGLKSDGSLTLNIADGTTRKDATIGTREGTNAISDGFWHHVAVSFDRHGLATCFLDGRVVVTVSITGLGTIDAGLPTVIGCDALLGTNTYWYCGSLDELAVWRRQLTPDDISLIRNRGLSGQALTGTTIIDSDADGLADGWEMSNFGNLAQTGEGDPDKDGVVNRLEYAAGSSPSVSQPDPMTRITLVPLPGGAPGQTTSCICFRRDKSSSNSLRYVVEHSLDGATWQSGGLVQGASPVSLDAATEEVQQYVPAALNGDRRLFRVRVSQQYQGATDSGLAPTVEYTSNGILVTWTTATPSSTILEYGANRQFTSRYEDWNLSTTHQVLLTGLGEGDNVSVAVVSILDGIETRSQSFATDTASNYSPAAIVDQHGFVTGGTYAAQAAAILTQSGIVKGHVLDAGGGNGKLAYELARQSEGLIVTCIETDPALVQSARTFLSQRGVYGSRVRVMQVSSLSSGLRFRKGTFNLIVSAANLDGRLDATASTTLSAALQGYLVPSRGKSYFNLGSPAVTTRPPLAYAGKWTSNYANNGNTSATEETFNGMSKASDLPVQWIGRPDAGSTVERQVRAHIPLASNGRFYCPCDDEIVTVDSRNGFILWSKQVPGFNRFNMMRDGGNMVCDDDGLYVALQNQCVAYGGETGNVVQTYHAPSGARTDFTWLWGFIAREGNQLVGSTVKDDAFYTSHWGWDNWFDYESGYGTDQVCADVIFAQNKTTGATTWSRQQGLVLNVSITIGNGQVYFLESRNTALPGGTSRRLGMAALKTNLYLVCLNVNTGALVWEDPLTLTGGTPTVLLQFANNKLLLTTADGGADKFYLYAYDPANGVQSWTANHSWAKADHGGATQHPVIAGDKVWIEPKCYNLQTGALLTGTSGIPTMPSRPACATWVGSKNQLLYRGAAGRIQYGGNLNMWNPAASLSTGWTRLRTSCWISAIPADGMVLSKEGGGGCSCGAWLETSVGFAPLTP